mgnify:CR=1 FL=1
MLKENPIASVKEGSGAVRIRRFASASLEYPILNHIKKYPPTGTVGVLTQTNDDALKVMALLNHEKIKAKLIQDSDGFALRDLMEFRSFLKWIQKENEPIISTEDWNSAVERLKVKYQRSSILALCLRALDVYKNQSDRLYRNDFKLFLMESKISDFDRGTKKEVVVSTFASLAGVDEENEADMDGLVRELFTPLSSIAFMAFCLLYIPCLHQLLHHSVSM